MRLKTFPLPVWVYCVNWLFRKPIVLADSTKDAMKLDELREQWGKSCTCLLVISLSPLNLPHCIQAWDGWLKSQWRHLRVMPVSSISSSRQSILYFRIQLQLHRRRKLWSTCPKPCDFGSRTIARTLQNFIISLHGIMDIRRQLSQSLLQPMSSFKRNFSIDLTTWRLDQIAVFAPNLDTRFS